MESLYLGVIQQDTDVVCQALSENMFNRISTPLPSVFSFQFTTTDGVALWRKNSLGPFRISAFPELQGNGSICVTEQ